MLCTSACDRPNLCNFCFAIVTVSVLLSEESVVLFYFPVFPSAYFTQELPLYLLFVHVVSLCQDKPLGQPSEGLGGPFWPISVSVARCWCWGGLMGREEQHWCVARGCPLAVHCSLSLWWDKPCQTYGLTALAAVRSERTILATHLISFEAQA